MPPCSSRSHFPSVCLPFPTHYFSQTTPPGLNRRGSQSFPLSFPLLYLSPALRLRCSYLPLVENSPNEPGPSCQESLLAVRHGWSQRSISTLPITSVPEENSFLPSPVPGGVRGHTPLPVLGGPALSPITSSCGRFNRPHDICSVAGLDVMPLCPRLRQPIRRPPTVPPILLIDLIKPPHPPKPLSFCPLSPPTLFFAKLFPIFARHFFLISPLKSC